MAAERNKWLLRKSGIPQVIYTNHTSRKMSGEFLQYHTLPSCNVEILSHTGHSRTFELVWALKSKCYLLIVTCLVIVFTGGLLQFKYQSKDKPYPVFDLAKSPSSDDVNLKNVKIFYGQCGITHIYYIDDERGKLHETTTFANRFSLEKHKQVCVP